jgi:hypothetical protein
MGASPICPETCNLKNHHAAQCSRGNAILTGRNMTTRTMRGDFQGIARRLQGEAAELSGAFPFEPLGLAWQGPSYLELGICLHDFII